MTPEEEKGMKSLLLTIEMAGIGEVLKAFTELANRMMDAGNSKIGTAMIMSKMVDEYRVRYDEITKKMEEIDERDVDLLLKRG